MPLQSTPVGGFAVLNQRQVDGATGTAMLHPQYGKTTALRALAEAWLEGGGQVRLVGRV